LTAIRDRIWPILAFVALVSLVVGCTQPPSEGPTNRTTTEIDPNGELITNVGSEPDTIDPQKESFVDEIGHTMKVFEALMTFDVKTGKPIPAAARDNPTVSADGKAYTFTLRDGLKYSDGRAVTAADFKYGFTRLCDPATAGNYAFTGYIIVGCEAWNRMEPRRDDPARLAAAKKTFQDAITVNGSEITFNLTDPAPYFPLIAGLWVGVPTREDMVTKGGATWTEPATYIGNGPFVMREWKHSDHFVYVRNPNYRNPPKLAKWTNVMINEGAVAFAAYRNNDIDVYGIVAEDLRQIQGDPQLSKEKADAPGSCTFYMSFNLTKAPFDDPNVRMAFAKSFDRDNYVNDVQKVGTAALSFIAPGLPGHDAQDAAQKFDAPLAKALLAQATPTAQAALRSVKVTYASNARAKTRLEWFQQQWKSNLGIDITLDPVDATTFRSLVKRLETIPQISFLGWCADYYDQQNWLTTVFSSKTTVTPTGYRSAAFDDLVFTADKESDQRRRDDLYLQASRVLSKDAPAAWVYYDANPVLIKPWVKNLYLTALGFELARFTDVYVTKH
jgi:oligopeptide transport system substrate-binding protein